MSLYHLTEKQLAKLKPTHIAYADEANPNFGRFRSVAAVTMKIDDCEDCKERLNRILQESNVSEFKWKDLGSARHRFAALKIIDLIMTLIDEKLIRIDTVIWDIEDSRHNIKKRYDVGNLRRMYYFLFRNILGRRWGEEYIWEIYTDENTSDANRSLQYLGVPEEISDDARDVNVLKVVEAKSHLEPLIQIADFFAGLSIYSRASFSAYENWCKGEERQTNISKSDLERCKVLDYFYKSCKDRKLGVSLASAKGLRTMNPKNPINFWWYEPQGDYDKAQTKWKTKKHKKSLDSA